MVLATWWYEDEQPDLELPAGVTVESPVDDERMMSLAALSAEEVRRRRDDGHRPYIARVDGVAAAYGWVGTRSCSIGELDLVFTLPAGNRYLWDFATLPAFRGRGIYPHLLAEIIRHECPPAVRLWVIHAPENLPSGVGIARAGFSAVAELSFSGDGRAALRAGADAGRANAAAALLGLPLVSSELDSCWVCGGSCRDHSEEDGECRCAIQPHPSAVAQSRGASGRELTLVQPAMHGEGGDDPKSQVEASTVRVHPGRATRRIGPIVAASVFGGLLAALVAVLGPFGGAAENTVTGAALFGLSMGCAALGLLSARLTDQPQRWATVSAFVIAALATFLMAWPGAMVSEWMSWLWPPVALVFVLWMAFEARRHMHSRFGLGLLYGVFGLASLAAIGGGVERVLEVRDERAMAMPGRLVSVGDHRLHIFCSGEGSPTVVLEPGLGETSSEMSGWIAPSVSPNTRVCVYDRAGRGWSEAAGSPQDGVAVANDLHTLLQNSGEAGPYVLAGHSLGGIYVMIFANLYPDDVAGAVLLDSMHPEQYERVSAYPTFYKVFRRASGVLPSLSRFGIARLVASRGSGGLAAGARDEERASWSTPRQFRSLRDEFAVLRKSLNEAGNLRSLGHWPLIVVTAGSAQEDGWASLQEELARLSSDALHRTVSDSDHAGLVEERSHAVVSSNAIIDVVNAVRAGGALTAAGQRRDPRHHAATLAPRTAVSVPGREIRWVLEAARGGFRFNQGSSRAQWKLVSEP